MTERQTRNISLPPHQSTFVDAMVANGRYKTASEVLRDGLRLLEENEHRRLLEKWLYEGLSDAESARLPADLKARAASVFRDWVSAAMQDVEKGRVTNGPSAMQRLLDRLSEVQPD